MSPIASVIANSGARGKVRTPQAGAVQPFFRETFSGGQLNPYGGFAYSNDRGAINGFTVVAAGAPGAQVKPGFTHSLQCTYPGSAIGFINSLPQLNFSWPTELNEFWFEWEVHFPANYFHRNNYTPGTPNVGLSDNNKFWMFWGGVYSSGYHQVACELNPSVVSAVDELATGESRRRPLMKYSDGIYANIESINGETIVGPTRAIVPGTWNTIRGYIRKASAIGVNDGIWKMWINGTVSGEATGLAMGASDPAKFATGINQGYFHGASNSGYTNDTTFHTQVMEFYSSNPGWI